ncbi:MAG: response regulator transcription factor [Bacillaceae bacterium]|nr:response regulator transcription factor [Bacillaceae bacterium]
MEPYKILIVDDHEVVRTGLSMLVQAHPRFQVIGEARDGREAIQKVYQQEPDLVLMDLSMPQGLDGLQATREIKKINPDIKIVILTMYDESVYLWRVIKAGAEGYVLKQDSGSTLIKVMERVIEGQQVYETSLDQSIVQDMLKKRDQEEEDAYRILTDREREIVILTAQGYRNKEIAEQLNISVKTVENHKSKIMNKLGIHERHELIDYAKKNKLLELY